MAIPDLGTIAGIAAVVMAIVGLLKTQCEMHGRATVAVAAVLSFVLAIGHASFTSTSADTAVLWEAAVRGLLAWVAALGVSWSVRAP